MTEKLICFGGLDLSKRTDFSAFSLYFDVSKDNDNRRYAEHKFYIPQEQIKKKMAGDTYLVEQWCREGYITATPGETIDYSFIYNDIIKANQKYDLRQVRYDRNLAEFLVSPLLDAGVCMVDFSQSIVQMSEPTKAWEVAVRRGLVIDNNPVMRWMVSCATIMHDPNDNIKVIKPDFMKSSKRIDGVITSIMANSGLEAYYADLEYKKTLKIEDMIV